MTQRIALKDHPSNLAPEAVLVSGTRERISIYRVKLGFLATFCDGTCLDGHFASEAEARAALTYAV